MIPSILQSTTAVEGSMPAAVGLVYADTEHMPGRYDAHRIGRCRRTTCYVFRVAMMSFSSVATEVVATID